MGHISFNQILLKTVRIASHCLTPILYLVNSTLKASVGQIQYINYFNAKVKRYSLTLAKKVTRLNLLSSFATQKNTNLAKDKRMFRLYVLRFLLATLRV